MYLTLNIIRNATPKRPFSYFMCFFKNIQQSLLFTVQIVVRVLVGYQLVYFPLFIMKRDLLLYIPIMNVMFYPHFHDL